MDFIHVRVSAEGEFAKQSIDMKCFNYKETPFGGLMGRPRTPGVWHVDCQVPPHLINQGRLVFTSDYPYAGAIGTFWVGMEPLVYFMLLSGKRDFHEHDIVSSFWRTLPEGMKVPKVDILGLGAGKGIYSVVLNPSINPIVEVGVASVFFSLSEKMDGAFEAS